MGNPFWELIISFFSGFASILYTGKQKPIKNEINVKVELNSIESEKQLEKTVVKKIINIFESHDVHLNEIPRVVPLKFGITLSVINDSSKFLEKITPEFIDWVSGFFGVRREYIEKDENRIYITIDYYKNERRFLDLIKSLVKDNKEFEIYAFKNVKDLDRQVSDKYSQFVNLAIRVKIFDEDGLVIYKTIPTSTLWYWGYAKCRYQLKSIIRVLNNNVNVYFKGYNLGSDFIEALSQGKMFYKELVIPCTINWHPDDYSFRSSESAVAKEVDEIEEVVQYMKDYKYEYDF